jgi:hypothetical protein
MWCFVFIIVVIEIRVGKKYTRVSFFQQRVSTRPGNVDCGSGLNSLCVVIDPYGMEEGKHQPGEAGSLPRYIHYSIYTLPE